MHVFSDTEEMVVAADEDDARQVMRDLYGHDAWSPDVEIEQMPDDKHFDIAEEAGGTPIRKTFGEWAAEKGRGYLCGPAQ